MAEEIYNACEATRKPSAVAPCTRSITVALVRHCVLSALPEEKEKLEVLKKLAPQQPEHLCSPAHVVPLKQNDCARYGIRGLRSGHVYFFAKRAATDWKLDGYFQILPGAIYGASTKRALEYYPETITEASQLLTRCTAPLSYTVQILNPRDVQELRVLFTPHALSAQRVKDILADESLRSKIPAFALSDIVDVPTASRATQPNVITRDGLDQSIAEMIAVKEWGKAELQYTPYSEEVSDEDIIYNHSGFALLQEQYFSIPDANSGLGGSSVWEKLPEALKGKGEERGDEGVVFVLEDPIGMTEELNIWRNEVYVQFKKHYLEKEIAAPTGYKKITKEWQIDTINMVSDLESNYTTYSKYASISLHWLRYINAKISMMGAIGTHKSYEHLLTHHDSDALNKKEQITFRETQLDAIQAAKEASRNVKSYWANLDAAVKKAFPEYGEFTPPENYPNSISTAEQMGGTLQSNYGRYYNHAQYETLKADYDSTWAKVKQEVTRRAAYHLAWLADEGTPLLDALEMYDPANTISGVHFTSVIGNCIEGMGADEIVTQFSMSG